MHRIAVIGSGFGGLAVAIRLQAQGFHVSIFEKNASVGGHASQLVKNGYTFDMGPSLITAPDIIRSVFASAGRRMEEYIDLLPLDPYYRIYFHDGTHLDYTGDSDAMKSAMAQFHPGDAAAYDHFMAHTKKIYDAVITDGLGATPFMDLGTMAGFLPQALRLGALKPAYSFVKKYFRDPRHRFCFSFHPLFIGGNPFRAPSVYLMIPYLEKAGGVWFTTGGMYSLVQAFERLFLELGGEIRRIVVRNGRACGVETATGEHREYDAVVSNADVIHTYSDLVAPEQRRKWSERRLRSTKYSMSAFLLYIGVKKQYPQLLHHTLILSERYRELVYDIFDRRILPDDFSMYLHVPTRTDPAMAPPGCESMYVLVPVANLASGIEWEKIKHSYADRLLDFLEKDFGMEGLRAHIDVLEIFTPEDFRTQRNSYLGSAWGAEPHLLQTAYFRPHNRSEDIKRLYFVGAGTHPGAGVPGVLLTAEATANVLLRDMATHPAIPA